MLSTTPRYENFEHNGYKKAYHGSADVEKTIMSHALQLDEQINHFFFLSIPCMLPSPFFLLLPR